MDSETRRILRLIVRVLFALVAPYTNGMNPADVQALEAWMREGADDE